MLRSINRAVRVVCCASLLLGAAIVRAGEPGLPRLTVERPAKGDDGITMSDAAYAEACGRLLRETYGARVTDENAWPGVVELINQHIALVERVAAPLPGSDKRRRVMPESLYDQNAERQQWLEDLASTRALAREMLALSEREGLFAKMASLCTKYNMMRPSNAGVLSTWKFLAISNTREMARLNMARMQLAAEAGDWTSLASAYEDTLMLARVAATEPLLVSQLVGYATAGAARRELRRHVLEATPSAAMLRELIEMQERQGPFAAPAVWLAGERSLLSDMVEDKAFPDNRGEARRLIADFFAGFVRVANVPRWKRDAKVFDAAEFVRTKVRAGTMLGQMLPAFENNLRGWDVAQSDVAGTQTLLAVLMYKAERGMYPETLDALVPTYLSAMPEDPWQRGGLVYKRFEKPDEFGRGFTLYSVGLDGEDNGGAWNPDVSKSAFEAGGKGTDFVFNHGKAAAAR